MKCIQLHCAIEKVVDGTGLCGNAYFHIGDGGLVAAIAQFVVQQHLLLIGVNITRPDDNTRDTTPRISLSPQ